jgi:hypothetical protein
MVGRGKTGHIPTNFCQTRWRTRSAASSGQHTHLRTPGTLASNASGFADLHVFFLRVQPVHDRKRSSHPRARADNAGRRHARAWLLACHPPLPECRACRRCGPPHTDPLAVQAGHPTSRRASDPPPAREPDGLLPDQRPTALAHRIRRLPSLPGWFHPLAPRVGGPLPFPAFRLVSAVHSAPNAPGLRTLAPVFSTPHPRYLPLPGSLPRIPVGERNTSPAPRPPTLAVHPWPDHLLVSVAAPCAREPGSREWLAVGARSPSTTYFPVVGAMASGAFLRSSGTALTPVFSLVHTNLFGMSVLSQRWPMFSLFSLLFSSLLAFAPMGGVP